MAGTMTGNKKDMKYGKTLVSELKIFQHCDTKCSVIHSYMAAISILKARTGTHFNSIVI
jgi:hypothetical protein